MSAVMSFTLICVTLTFYSLVTGKPIQKSKVSEEIIQNLNEKNTAAFIPDQNPSDLINNETRQKRSRRDLNEIRDLNDIIEDLEENSIVQSWPTEIDIENMQPRAFYLLVQKIKQLQNNDPYRVKTPRLGRNVDIDYLDEQQSPDYSSKLLKKSVPFKPRLGKRSNRCN